MNKQHKQTAVMTVVGMILLLTAATATATELKGTPDELRNYLRAETRTVTLNDMATETAYTDVAKITLIVSTKEKTLAASLARNNELRDSVARQLAQSGMAGDDVRSSKYSASPQYRWFGNTPSSFEVVNTLLVTVDQDSEFRRVAEIADQDEAISFGGVAFEHSEKEKYEDRVRDKALDAVLKDREYFEGKLGLRLNPVSFTFSDVNARGYGQYDDLEEIVVTGFGGGVSPASKSPAVPTTFDEVEYRVSVSVSFEVAPAE